MGAKVSTLETLDLSLDWGSSVPFPISAPASRPEDLSLGGPESAGELGWRRKREGGRERERALASKPDERERERGERERERESEIER